VWVKACEEGRAEDREGEYWEEGCGACLWACWGWVSEFCWECENGGGNGGSESCGGRGAGEVVM
jgi:hypothetical protein